MRCRRGFTLIELITVVFVLSILATMGLLKYIDLRNNARAAQVAEELHAIQIAAFSYYSDNEQWPPDAGAGAVPNGLGALLPGQLAMSFDRGEYLLDWDNFGGGGFLGGPAVVGISVTTTDPKLFAKLAQYLGGGGPFFIAGNKLTYIIAGPGGAF